MIRLDFTNPAMGGPRVLDGDVELHDICKIELLPLFEVRVEQVSMQDGGRAIVAEGPYEALLPGGVVVGWKGARE